MESMCGSVLSTTLQVLFDRIAQNQEFLVGLFPGNKKLQLNRLIRVLRILSPVLQDAENKQEKSSATKAWFNSIRHAVYQADDVLDEINTERLRINLQHSKGDLSYTDNDFGDLSDTDNDFSDLRDTDIDTDTELSPTLEEVCDTDTELSSTLEEKCDTDTELSPTLEEICDTDFSDEFIGDLSPTLEEIFDTDFSDEFDTDFSDEFIGDLSPTLEEICDTDTELSLEEICDTDTELSSTLEEKCDTDTELSSTLEEKCDTDFSDQFIGELSPTLEEICDALERTVQRIGMLGLRILDGKQKREDKRLSTSVVNKTEIFGRDDEKEKIIQMVLSGEGGVDISVIPITGMGGIGKTTLAQLVYNDERVKSLFKTRAWICISEEFDVYRATKDLLKEVNPSAVNDKDDLNCLQVKLKDKLEGKRFIIILDDIWNDNYNDCQHLMRPLNSGSRGSKIIVTTRNENIAVMLQNQPFHHLKPITDDQSWSLFKLHVFDNRAPSLSPEFETIGRRIVEKCKGLPLAVKTIAGALRSTQDIREWHDISNNDNWVVEGDILPALSLSYKLLPSHLKCCFDFCGLLPKDVPFTKDEVVLLWMANGLVQPLTEKFAQNYFEELRSRSFFEKVEGLRSPSLFGEVVDEEYIMHDLINDLARIVSGNFCARIEDYHSKDLHQRITGENNLPPEILHLSYMSSYYDTLERFRGLAQVQGLRTFLPIHQFDCGDRQQITTLFFSDILPKLRYIRALSLYPYLFSSVVPFSIGHLKHLRFLNLATTLIKKLPNGIPKCLNLQTLILAGCSKLKELPEDMRFLINLQHLDISYCCLLKELPKDMGLLNNLQHLNIRGCEELKELPEDMGLLINLQHLNISRCWRLKELPNNMGLLINLQYLDISGCSKLEKLPEGMELLTNLQHLDIRDCSKLEKLPDVMGLLINLQYFDISHCVLLKKLPEDIGLLKDLQHLDIRGCSELEKLPEDMRLLISLQRLNISDWVLLKKLPEDIGLLTNLQHLDISRCVLLKKLPEDIVLLKNLQHLDIRGCSELKKLPEDIGLLTNLQHLDVRGCSELEKLPEDMRLLTNLQYLDIRGCCKLEKLPEGMGVLMNVEIHSDTPKHFDKLKLGQLLQISLVNAVTVEMAKNAELKNKNHLENLTLEWSGNQTYSEDEWKIFSELIPHTNIRQLSICGYRGTSFSDWLGDSSFCNIASLTLEDCKKCIRLPPLGQLTGLKVLEISGMDGIREVGEEFYGNSSICKPFKVLEKFSFSQMAEWTTWNMHPENADFLSLKKFEIRHCPKLVGDIPFHLTSLRTLEMTIINCPSISLYLQSCGLKRLAMQDCKHVEFLADDICNSSLESLSIVGCGGSTETIPLFSFSKLQELTISFLRSPSMFKIPNKRARISVLRLTSLQKIEIRYCDNILSFPKGGLPAPNLKELRVVGCSKLKSLPEEMHTQLSSLLSLSILDCPEMECFPDGGLPHSLERLEIRSCKKLTMFPRNWGSQRLPSLEFLRIDGMEDKLFPEEGLLPATLKTLTIWSCPNLEALNHKGFQYSTSLKQLEIYYCRKLRYLPEEGLPSSLSKLTIEHCPKLKVRNWSKVSHIPIILVDNCLIS